MIKKILFILLLSITSLGFSQEKTIDGLSASPNPFTNTTKISFTDSKVSNVLFTVRNVLGKTVFKKNFISESGINTIPFYKDNLSAGMYIYSIQDKEKIISKRFVIR